MKMSVVSKTIHLGKDSYIRINANKSFSILAFGSFSPNENGLRYGWINIERNKIPKNILQELER
jgi:hypothetical protein